MTSKQRVYHALKKQPVDRVPIFMWFHPQTTELLAKLLEIPSRYIPLVMGDDIRQAWTGNNGAMEGTLHSEQGQTHTDLWGIEWIKQGEFNQIKNSPLANAAKQEVLNYSFPMDSVDKLTDLMEPATEHSKDYFIGCDISPCVFEMYWRLRGLDSAMYDFGLEPDMTKEMLNRCSNFSIKLAEAAIDRFKLDWLWTGDDIGGQTAMMISPQAWREFIKPGLKKIFDVAKSKNLLIAFHSCGAIKPIIADLIEIGIDVLNPIQCNCPGMNPLELKHEYGKEIAFMGGVDTQNLLPNATADQVRKETALLIEGMTKDGGGYILAASHTIPPETPFDNIFAMYHEAGITKEEIFDKAAQIRNSNKN